jgi:hypothetical protein
MLRHIVRLRWVIFALVVVVNVAAFNGRWRVGPDSALYREVARNLAEGRGYTFRGEHHDHAYPGLPSLLAGIDRVFGPQDALRPRVAIAVMVGISLLTVVLVHRLVGLYFPPWLAVCVAGSVGLNYTFIQHAHDLLTDMPFLLGVVSALLGIGELARSATARRRAAWGAVAAAGMVIAIAMRPTFWALAGAMLGACLIHGIRSPKGWRFLAGAMLVVLVVALWLKFDPRPDGTGGIGGKYEAAALVQLHRLTEINWPWRLHTSFAKHFPDGMLGVEIGWLGYLYTAAVVVGSVALMRVSVLWGLCVLCTMGMTLIAGSKPRYYLMVLPIAMTTWTWLVYWLACRLPAWKSAGPWVLTGGLAVAMIPNLVRSIDFVLEQHGIDRKFRRHEFLDLYRRGNMRDIARMGEAIRQHVPAQQSVLGLEPRILTYLGERPVFSPSELDGRAPKDPAAALHARRIGWVILRDARSDSPGSEDTGYSRQVRRLTAGRLDPSAIPLAKAGRLALVQLAAAPEKSEEQNAKTR